MQSNQSGSRPISKKKPAFWGGGYDARWMKDEEGERKNEVIDQSKKNSDVVVDREPAAKGKG